LEDARRNLEQLNVTIDILTRETAATADHSDRLADLQKLKLQAAAEVKSLTDRWEKESRLIQEIRQIREKMGAGPKTQKPAPTPETPTQKPAPDPSPAAEPLTDSQRQKLRAQATELSATLKALQGETPLAQVSVDGQAVAEVVAGWTGIPVGRMVARRN